MKNNGASCAGWSGEDKGRLLVHCKLHPIMGDSVGTDLAKSGQCWIQFEGLATQLETRRYRESMQLHYLLCGFFGRKGTWELWRVEITLYIREYPHLLLVNFCYMREVLVCINWESPRELQICACSMFFRILNYWLYMEFVYQK